MGAGGVRGVFFDRDGTLVDSLGVVVDCYRRAIVEFEGPDRSADQIFASFSIGLARAMLSELIGRPVGDMAVVRYESLLADRCDEIRPYQGIRDAVARLGRSLPFTVFTAADTSAANIIIGATGLSPFFASVVGADLVASTQAAPIVWSRRPVGSGWTRPRSRTSVTAHRTSPRPAPCGALAIAAAWGHQHDPARDADLVADAPGHLVTLLLGRAVASPAPSP